MTDNPFAAPSVEVDPRSRAPGSLGRVWREGKLLMLDRDAMLPPRCVKCNAPEAGRKRLALSWHPPWVFLLILGGLLVYVIVALIVRKSAKLEVGLCDAHRRRRRSFMLLGTALLLLGIGGCFAGIGNDGPALTLTGVALFLIALGVLAFSARLLTPARIDEQLVQLKGASAVYLDSLPNAPV